MIAFATINEALHKFHDAVFGDGSHGNPWVDHLRHMYHDADHLHGLGEFIVGTILLPTAISIYCLWPVLAHTRRSSKEGQMKNPSEGIRRNLVISAILVILPAILLVDEPKHPTFITGMEPRLQELLEECPIMKRGPQPSFWFRNRHVQLIPWMLQNAFHSLYGLPFQRIEFTVTDCVDKSIPGCSPDDSMNDTITLDIFPPFADHDQSNSTIAASFDRSAPVILFTPGLRCHSQDLPSNSILRTVYGKGFRSNVVNRRGHTPGTTLKAPRWNLFGDVDDLEQIYWHVKRNLIDDNTPMFLHGISSGTATVVSALSAWDKRALLQPELETPTFVGAVSLSPGYDISTVLRPERFKWPYNPLLTQLVKDHFLGLNEAMLRDFNSTAYEEAMAANSLQGVVDASAPFAGYPDAKSYYDHVNPVNELQYITTPSFVLNAVDDPCCHIDNLYERSERHNGTTYAEIVANSERSFVVVTHTGSHCPFLDGPWWWPFVRDPYSGGIMLRSWADQSIAEFYEAALKVYNDRRYL